MHHGSVKLIPGRQSWPNIWKEINVINHVNRHKEKKKLIGTEKAFEKSTPMHAKNDQHTKWTICWDMNKILNLIENSFVKFIANLTLLEKEIENFPQTLGT